MHVVVITQTCVQQPMPGDSGVGRPTAEWGFVILVIQRRGTNLHRTSDVHKGRTNSPERHQACKTFTLEHDDMPFYL